MPGPFSIIGAKLILPARQDLVLPPRCGLTLKWPYQGVKATYVVQPSFQIASFRTPLATDGLLNCAALIFLDRRAARHYLAHIDMTISARQIRASFKGFDLANSERYILPGPLCEETAQNIMAALSAKGKGQNLQVLGYSGFGLRGITSYRGELFLPPTRAQIARSAGRSF
jgi:hypothetical protein